MTLGIATVLGIFAMSSLYMSNSSARLERKSALNQLAIQIGKAALEETLVKLQNGAAMWTHDSGDDKKNTKLSWTPVATTMMYDDPGVKIAPVRVLARKLNETSSTPEKDRFYSMLSTLPAYHPQHQEGWEKSLTGVAAELVKPPAGVTLDPAVGTRFAQQYKSAGQDDPLRKILMELPTLSKIGDDAQHSDAELAPFKLAVNGNTMDGDAGADGARGQAPAAAGAARGRNTPQAAGASNRAAQAAAAQDSTCGVAIPAKETAQGAIATAAAVAGKDFVSPKRPGVRQLNNAMNAGDVLHNSPWMMTMETDVNIENGLGMTSHQYVSANRVVGEYNYKEAANWIAGRLLAYWIKHNNLTVKDAFRMGWVNSATKPEAQLSEMYPDIAPILPLKRVQVWPFAVANSELAFRK
jgi:hypothetical protein